MQCQTNTKEVEQLLTAYNDIIERLNNQMQYLAEAIEAKEIKTD